MNKQILVVALNLLLFYTTYSQQQLDSSSFKSYVAKPKVPVSVAFETRMKAGNEYLVVKIDSFMGKNWLCDKAGNPVITYSFISKDNSLSNAQLDEFFWTKKSADSIKKKYGIKIWNMIIERELKIGWSEELCLLSWGPPNKINSTETSTGDHEQWVYHGRNLYFKNGKLNAIQRY